MAQSRKAGKRGGSFRYTPYPTPHWFFFFFSHLLASSRQPERLEQANKRTNKQTNKGRIDEPFSTPLMYNSHNRPFHSFNSWLGFWDQLAKTREHSWKEHLETGEAAKFESDLFKTNEDIAPVSHRILQTFVQGGRGDRASHHTNVCKISRLCGATSSLAYDVWPLNEVCFLILGHSFQQCQTKLGGFIVFFILVKSKAFS